MCIGKNLSLSLALVVVACAPTKQELHAQQYCVNKTQGWRQITKGFECTRWGGDPVERSIYLASDLPVGRPEWAAEEAAEREAERREAAAREAADRVERRTEVEYDRHEDRVRVRAPLQTSGSYTYLLRAWFQPGQMERALELGEETGLKELEALGEPSIQLYVSAKFSDWASTEPIVRVADWTSRWSPGRSGSAAVTRVYSLRGRGRQPDARGAGVAGEG